MEVEVKSPSLLVIRSLSGPIHFKNVKKVLLICESKWLYIEKHVRIRNIAILDS